MTGKGDKRRPCQVSEEIAGLNWDLAFGTEEEKRDAEARLAFLRWEEAQQENPHLWGEREK